MISQLVRAILLGVVGFSTLCAGAILFGSQQDAPELFRHFGKCGSKPCYLGIVTGTTAWAEAIDDLQNRPELEFDRRTMIVHRPPGFTGDMRLLASGSVMVVGELDMNIVAASVSIGDIVAHLGTPCAIVRNGLNAGLVFPGMSVLVRDRYLNADDMLRPEMLVNRIYLVDAITSCEHIPDGFGGYGWKGFTRYTR